jgi:hypothetical protein
MKRCICRGICERTVTPEAGVDCPAAAVNKEAQTAIREIAKLMIRTPSAYLKAPGELDCIGHGRQRKVRGYQQGRPTRGSAADKARTRRPPHPQQPNPQVPRQYGPARAGSLLLRNGSESPTNRGPLTQSIVPAWNRRHRNRKLPPPRLLINVRRSSVARF